MRIVIDLQGAQTNSRLRGIGRYSTDLAVAMLRNRREHEILLCLSGLFPETLEPIRSTFRGLLPRKDIHVWTSPGPVTALDSANDWRRSTAEIVREEYLSSLNPDVVHVSSMMEVFGDNAVHSIGRFDHRALVAATFYDVIPLIQRSVYLDPNPALSSAYMEKLEHLKRADLLLAISESARGEAIRYLDRSDDRAVNIGTAVDDQFRVVDIDAPTRARLAATFGFRSGFVMYSGATDERKNHLRLIESFSMLPPPLRERFPLLIVGGMSASHVERFVSHARSFGLTSAEFVLTGRVSDADLVALYNLCSLFVLPSWHEGFGLPALEAMSCGAAVIGSNTTSIPEVIGREDALFDPHSARSIADKMTEVLENDAFRQELASHGLQQARKFSWDRTANLALDALERTLAAERKPAASVGTLDPDRRIASIVSKVAREPKAGATDVDLIGLAQAIAINIAPGPESTLFLDISTIVRSDAKSGIQRVVTSLFRELRRTPPDGMTVQPIHFEDGHYRAVSMLSDPDGGTRRFSPSPEIVDFRPGDVYLALNLTAHLSDAARAIHQRLRQLGVDVYFVVYDILFSHRPDWSDAAAEPLLRQWLANVAEVATGLVCISAAVADEVRQWIAEHPSNRIEPVSVQSFHLGADFDSGAPSRGTPADAAEVLEWIRSGTSFLMVGTIEPRKGHAQAIAAFDLLWQKGLDVRLVIVGRNGGLVDELHQRLLAHPELGRRLLLLTNATDEFLGQVYGASSCLMVPSEGEGFGLPLIEAARKDRPIIARDIPVFREIAGESAFYFNGKTSQALAEAIIDWLALHANGAHPRSTGMPWLTWEQSAQRLLETIGLRLPGQQ